MPLWSLRIVDTPEEMEAAVALQRLVWPGSETELVPAHMLLAAVHNGGLLIAAYDQEPTSPFGALLQADEIDLDSSSSSPPDGAPGATLAGVPSPALSGAPAGGPGEAQTNGPTPTPEPAAAPADAHADAPATAPADAHADAHATAPAPAPADAQMIGLVFGFPGLISTPDGLHLKHYSHLLAVHPAHRSQGLGFALKRAQWQMARRQGLEHITWTYDPLLSRNAYLNISRLGGVCGAYLPNAYGTLKDDVNAGLPSDRFVVDWWLDSRRVTRRLGKRPRRPLELADYLAAGVEIVNRTALSDGGWAQPGELPDLDWGADQRPDLLLAEIPSDFDRLRTAEPALALAWRRHSRSLFTNLFAQGYLVTDFIYLPASPAPGSELDGRRGRSFYVFSHGESTF